MPSVSRALRGAGALALAAGLAAAQPPDPNDPRARALAAFQRDDLSEAERLLGGWLDSHPDDGEAWRLLGMMRLVTAQEKGRHGADPAEVRELAARVVEPLRNAERLAGGRPVPDLDHGLGWALLMGGHHAEACARFDRALESRPSPELLRLRATCAVELGRYAEAERDLARVAGTPADGPEARRLHARALFLQGREREARDLLDRYLESAGALPPAERFSTLLELARYASLMLDLDAAREALEEACPLKPDDASCRAGLGRVLFRLGDLDAATPELERAVAAAGPDSVRAEALQDLGSIALARSRPADARRHLEAALALEPMRGEALQALATALRRLGDDAAAREVLGRFRDVAGLERELARAEDHLLVSPNDHRVAVERIRLLLRLGRREEAARRFAELESRAPALPALEALRRELGDEG